VPGLLSLGEVQRVLQGLLAEEVPIRDLSRIYEALTLRAKVSTDPEGLVEAARGALGPALSAQYVQDGALRVLTLDPVFEQSLVEALRPSEAGTQIVTDPTRLEAMLERLRAQVADAEATGRSVVLVCAPALRPALRKVVLLALDRLPVLSYAEVTGGGVRIETVGVVSGAHAIAA
jgi:flagellar biosynthesis protein FlhA